MFCMMSGLKCILSNVTSFLPENLPVLKERLYSGLKMVIFTNFVSYLVLATTLHTLTHLNTLNNLNTPYINH